MSLFVCKECGCRYDVPDGEEVLICEFCGADQTVETEAQSQNIPADTLRNSLSQATPDTLIRRVFLYLEDEEWEKADEYCERILDLEPENAEAYMGKLMSELHIRFRQQLADLSVSFEEDKNYQKIIRFGSREQISELNEYLSAVKDRIAKSSEIIKGPSVPEKNVIISEPVQSADIITPKGKPCSFGYLDGDILYYIDNPSIKGMTIPERLWCYSIVSVVVIMSGNTEIKNSFFSDMKNLEKVIISDTVKTIGDEAFYGCSSLHDVTISEGVRTIGKSAFDFCSSLEKLVIPCSVTSIGENAFYQCSSLNELIFKGRVTELLPWTFYNCLQLKRIELPDSLVKIGSAVFSGCEGLTEVILQKGIKSIGNEAFSDCKSLSSIIIPEGVESIGNEAFRDCRSLTSVFIPDSVKSIGNKAFINCKNLSEIRMPSGISLGKDVFYRTKIKTG